MYVVKAEFRSISRDKMIIFLLCIQAVICKNIVNLRNTISAAFNGGPGRNRDLTLFVTLVYPQKSRYAWVYSYHKTSTSVNNSQLDCQQIVNQVDNYFYLYCF